MSNPFWDYSLAAYSQEKVAATCLMLQDIFDMDVNLLLYAAWLGHLNQLLSAGHLTELDTLVADWRREVVRPLRALRRQLHTCTEAAAIHEALKTLELGAEQQQQDVMYAFHRSATGLARADRPLLENLTRVAHLTNAGNGGWESAVRQLATLILL